MVHRVEAPKLLLLSTGERYELPHEMGTLKKYLQPDHVPHLEPGAAAVKVQVAHGDSGYTVTLAPNELERLLKRARRQAESQVEHPARPQAELDPSLGVGQRDPEVRRRGPNVEHRPDPRHRGADRLQRKP